MSNWTDGGWQTVSAMTLVALVVCAAWVDFREHRIPNALVLPGLAIALLMAHLPGGSISASLVGTAIALGMGLPLYLLKAMGAGDVKLMGMVGAFLGAPDMLVAALIIFIVGGLLGLVTVARHRAFAKLAENLKQMTFGAFVSVSKGSVPTLDAPAKSVGVQPYGVAIAVGTILYLALMKGGIFP